MADVGRPDKLTPQRAAAIVRDIADRIPYQLAAEANGICEDTLYEWIVRGLRDRAEGVVDSKYTKFSEDVKKAERDRVREHVNNIAERPERWQADAWILERRWYRHFGTNSQLMELQKKIERMEEQEKLANGLPNQAQAKEAKEGEDKCASTASQNSSQETAR